MNWGTWSLQPYVVPNSSFNESVSVPPQPPDTGPFVCAPISIYWLRYAIGALSQLRMPVAWKTVTEADVDSIMYQVDAFIGMIATATMCDERGTVSVTIVAGDASGSVDVVFPYAFESAPVVVVSCENPDLLASWLAVVDTGFTAVLTASVPVIADVTATLSWIAGPVT